MDDLTVPARRWRVSPDTAYAGRKTLEALDQLVVVTPGRVPDSLWRSLPELGALKRLVNRLGAAGRDRCFRHHLRNGTGVTFARMPGDGQPSAFRRLRFAGSVAAEALADEPRSIGLLPVGFVADDAAALTQALLLALGAHTSPVPAFRREQHPSRLRTLKLLTLEGSARSRPGPLLGRAQLERTLVEADGLNHVRWLTALPPNKLTTASYRALVADLAKARGWQHRFLDETALAREGAGAFLAVAQSNAARDAGIVHLRYRPDGVPRGTRPTVALVGKGIIFDTGGTNLKDAKNMLDMHTDMSGSAVALAVLDALTSLGYPEPVDCWLALTENRTGPSAYKPRDVVTACNGVSIEVMHSDAEGRMVLADTLALAGHDQPALILDYATLTGTCVYALSERYSGVFTNRDELSGLLVENGRASGERVWPFPMDEDFDDDLKSKAADILQCAVSSEGDHVLAARFLRRFVPEKSAWVHMDLSAATRKDGLGHVPGGATGFGLRYTLALLLDRADSLPQPATGERP